MPIFSQVLSTICWNFCSLTLRPEHLTAQRYLKSWVSSELFSRKHRKPFFYFYGGGMKGSESCRTTAEVLHWGKAKPDSDVQSYLRSLKSVIFEQSSVVLRACFLSSIPISLEFWFFPLNLLLCTAFLHSEVLKSSVNYTCSLQTKDTIFSFTRKWFLQPCANANPRLQQPS